MRTSRFVAAFLALVALGHEPAAGEALDEEARLFILGVWPNRLRLFDEATDAFVGEIQLRHGAVTSYGPTARSADGRRLYYITDRMEAVEIVDVARREVVDVVRLSTPERRVRIFAVAADPAGERLYMRARGVELGVDRFEPLSFEMACFDLERGELLETFTLPPEIDLGFFDTLTISSDGSEIITIGADIFRVDAASREIAGGVTLSKPLGPGYGPMSLSGFVASEPDVLQGLYTTVDPVQEKTMTGFVRIEVDTGRLTSFELGLELDVETVALSPDGRYAYAGLGDLVKIDLVERRIVARVPEFERGRRNTTILVSGSGDRLYVSGVGDRLYLVDAASLERAGVVEVGGDLMSPLTVVPRSSP